MGFPCNASFQLSFGGGQKILTIHHHPISSVKHLFALHSPDQHPEENILARWRRREASSLLILTGDLFQLQQRHFPFQLNKLSACRLAPALTVSAPIKPRLALTSCAHRTYHQRRLTATAEGRELLVIQGADANPPTALFATARNCVAVGRSG